MSYATIHYSGVNPFAGIAPAPFVGRSETMVQAGERLITEENFTLRGTITGRCTTEPEQFNEMMDMQMQLLNSFGTDFQSFDILDVDDTNVIHRDHVKVTSVSFPSNNYGSYHIYLPFEVNLQCYPGLSSGSGYAGDRYSAAGYAVLNPSHVVQYQENDDGTVQIEVTTAAKGINTSSTGNNALQNAINWVSDFKDWRPPNVSTVYGNLNSPCMRTATENINRYDGTYEARETYVVDQLGDGPGILRYTNTYSYDINEGISTIEIQGSIEGCIGTGGDTSIDDLRQRWTIFDLQAFSYAVVTYNGITNRYDLNPTVISKSVTEDAARMKITFSYTFNNDLRPPIYFDYKSSVEYDFENDSFTVSVQGEVLDRNPLKSYTNTNGVIISDKWQDIENYAAQINLFALAQLAFNAFATTNGVNISAYPLGSLLVATSRTEDLANFKLGLGATFKTQPAFLPPGWQKFDFTLSCTPALEQFKEFPCLDGRGQYQVFDLGYATRAQYELQVGGVAPDTGDTTGHNALEAMKNQMGILIAKNVVGPRINLDSQQITLGKASFARQVSANAGISVETPPFQV